jgi:hypothetical protein
MTQEERRRRAEAWRSASQDTAHAARTLFREERHRSAVSRAYYAAYQAGTYRCVLRGDEAQFPVGWNNPSHDQLPELLSNHGRLPIASRRRIRSVLYALRTQRETADYRPGRSTLSEDSLMALSYMDIVFRLLGLSQEVEE